MQALLNTKHRITTHPKRSPVKWNGSLRWENTRREEVVKSVLVAGEVRTILSFVSAVFEQSTLTTATV